jgi:inner membrane protein
MDAGLRETGLNLENLTHTFVGIALSKTGLEKRADLATPLLVVAANLPDADIVSPAFGVGYLDFHRGITHAAMGVTVLSAALAGSWWGFERLLRRDTSRRARFLPLWLLSFLGLLTHPLLDYLNDYGIRPWLPFSRRWYYGDLISIVDPWIWIILGASLCVYATTRTGRIVWGTLGAAMVALIALAAGVSACIIWLVALAVAVAVAIGLKRIGLRPAAAALVVLLAYVAGTAAVRHSVLRQLTHGAPAITTERVERVDLLPARPGSGHRWVAVISTARRFYIADIDRGDLWTNRPSFEVFDKNLDQNCVRQALVKEPVAELARFARFPSAVVQTRPQGCTVFLRDLRYARRTLAGWGVASVTLGN